MAEQESPPPDEAESPASTPTVAQPVHIQPARTDPEHRPTGKRHRTALLAVRLVTGLTIVLGAGGSGLWWLGAVQAEKMVTAWADFQRDAGAEVALGPVNIGGFPILWRAELTQGRVRLADGTRWEGTGLAVDVAPWRLERWGLALTGPQRLSVGDGGMFGLTATSAGGEGEVVVDWQRGQPAETRGALRSLTLQVELGGARAGTPVRVDALTFSAVRTRAEPAALPAGTTALTLALTVDGIADWPPMLLGGVLGATIGQVGFLARVTGPFVGTDGASLSDWSKAGGALTLDDLRLVWGGLRVIGHGDLVLDAGLQPAGTLWLDVWGGAGAVDALVQARRLRQDTAETIKALLRGLAAGAGGAGNGTEAPDPAPSARLPLMIGNGMVRLGPFPIARLPRFHWRGGAEKI